MAGGNADPGVHDPPRPPAEDAGRVASNEVENYGKLRDIRDRSYRVRAVVRAWKE